MCGQVCSLAYKDAVLQFAYIIILLKKLTINSAQTALKEFKIF